LAARIRVLLHVVDLPLFFNDQVIAALRLDSTT
jgi:hypothetical protein